MRNKEKEICSFEEFVEKETNKEMLQCFIVSFIIALFIMLLIIIGTVINKNINIFEIKETEYNKVYELQDNSWFIIDRENDKFIFQPIELEDLLDIINDYSCIDYAEINGIYRNVEEMAEEMIESCYDIPDTLLFYMDLEKLGNDMLDDDNYYELSNGNIAYISL